MSAEHANDFLRASHCFRVSLQMWAAEKIAKADADWMPCQIMAVSERQRQVRASRTADVPCIDSLARPEPKVDLPDGSCWSGVRLGSHFDEPHWLDSVLLMLASRNIPQLRDCVVQLLRLEMHVDIKGPRRIQFVATRPRRTHLSAKFQKVSFFAEGSSAEQTGPGREKPVLNVWSRPSADVCRW